MDETFTALDWAGRKHGLLLAHASQLVQLVTYIPGKDEQMVRIMAIIQTNPVE